TEGYRGAGPQLREPVEIDRDDCRDARIAPRRLVVAHQHDRGAVAENLDIAGDDCVRDEPELPLVAEQPPGIFETHPHAIEARGDAEGGCGEALPQRAVEQLGMDAPDDAQG